MNAGAANFRAFIAERGFKPPERIEPGRWCPFSTNGKDHDTAGRAKLFPDGEGGIVHDWRTGESWTWQAARERAYTPAEVLSWREKCELAKRDAEAERERERKQTAERARAIWSKSQPAPDDHPYLIAKGVKSHGLRQYRGPLALNGLRCDGALLVPARTVAGELASLQFIAPDGTKRHLNGEKYPACYFAIGKPDGVLLIAEGYATGASVHETTGYAVRIAFDAGNLEPVAKALRAKLPDAKLILCADNDLHAGGKPNTGLKAANRAAQAVGGLIAVPEMDGGKCDFNDLAQECGAEALQRAVADARAPVDPEVQVSVVKAPAQPDGVRLIRAADLVPEKIRWCWDGWLARGKLQVIAGAPGTGKTTIALAVAATITTGGRWPDGTRCTTPGNVLIWSGEDDPTDTLLPRLLAMGANRDRIFFVGDVFTGGEVHSFDPARDVRDLLAKAGEVGDVRLMIVDPIVNAVLGDSHKNTEVRRALQPLVDMAAKLDAVVLGISHFSKGTAGRDPVERVTGSIAFGALARIVLAAAKVDAEDGKQGRILVRAKSNIGEDSGGFGYDIEQTQVPGYPEIIASRILWGDPITGSARELLAKADVAGEEHGAIHEAEEWLLGALDHGPMPAKELKQLADKQGIAAGTLRHAKDRTGVTHKREGFGKGATVIWSLPERPYLPESPIDVTQKGVASMGSVGKYGTATPETDPGAEVF